VNEPKPVTVAAAQYPIEFIGSWENYAAKITRLIDEAAAHGARILVFPEYASLELASIFPKDVYSSLPAQIDALQSCLPQFLELHRDLATKHGIYVLAGSYPVRAEDSNYHNRAHFFGPDGEFEFQEKLQMTRFENERWLVRPGSGIKIFDTRFGPVGVNVCYDVEFPLIAHRQIEAGAWLLLVPSCTDSAAGYNRVRVGCQARALENQCYVVMAPTVGTAEWSEAVDRNVGAAAVYTPPDRGFPSDGVLAIGEMNTAQWVYATLDPARIEEVRRGGQVFNHRDWPAQSAAIANDSIVVRL
jgi:predicted amidohydrolase